MRRMALGMVLVTMLAFAGCSDDPGESGDSADAATDTPTNTPDADAEADTQSGDGNTAEGDNDTDTPTPEPSPDEPEPAGTFAEWSAKMTAACTASAEAAALVTEPSGSAEALIEFAIISSEESVAVQAAGLPEDRTDDARRWLDIHQKGSNLFLQIAAEGTIDPLDVRSTNLQGFSAQLSEASRELGIEGCIGQQVG